MLKVQQISSLLATIVYAGLLHAQTMALYDRENEEVHVKVTCATCIGTTCESSTDGEFECYYEITVFDKINNVEYQLPLSMSQFKKYFKLKDNDLSEINKDGNSLKIFQKCIRDYKVTPVVATSVELKNKEEK